jgi:hypothetical protein
MNNPTIIELFETTIDHPENLIETGVPDNTLYNYVTDSYLNGLINLTDPIFGCVIERYEDWNKLDKTKWKIELKKEMHPKLSVFGDDVIILSESYNFYWFFWYDCDNSDCSIGKIHKLIVPKKDYILSLERYIKSFPYVERDEDVETIVGNYFELPLEYLKRGWIKF